MFRENNPVDVLFAPSDDLNEDSIVYSEDLHVEESGFDTVDDYPHVRAPTNMVMLPPPAAPHHSPNGIEPNHPKNFLHSLKSVLGNVKSTPHSPTVLLDMITDVTRNASPLNGSKAVSPSERASK